MPEKQADERDSSNDKSLEAPNDYEDLFDDISSTDDLLSDDELLKQINGDEDEAS